ncbi:hypothetical protein ABZ863_09175 [Saccharomonospora sp. NPDC046836]|uniref:hypothetical protein n=1 Tax=Saccharomonospora sp. NPDC046836 TaxID=3156921 RepID=UPI0033C4ED6F
MAYHPETKTMEEVESSPGSKKVDGAFGQLGDILAVLYREDDDVVLEVGNYHFWLGVQTGVSVVHSGSGLNRSLTIVRESSEDSVVVHYPLEEGPVPTELDSTPFIEDEDFDFGLYIANVANSPERLDRIYR